MDEKAGTSLASDVSWYLNEVDDSANNETAETYGMFTAVEDKERNRAEGWVRHEDPSILAVTRKRFSEEPPTGKALEQIKAQLHRVHKASGHASWHSLARLLQVRKAPSWAVNLAKNMQCPDCQEAKRPQSVPVASLHETPTLFEVVGTDIFEYEYKGRKHKFMMMRDRASGLLMVEHLRSYGGEADEEKSWEPTSEVIVKVLARWMMRNPSPKWLLTDSGTYYASWFMDDWLGRSGIGHLVAPAEARHLLGRRRDPLAS